LKDKADKEIKFYIEGRSYAGRRLQKALVAEILKREGPLSAYGLLKALERHGMRMSPSSLYALLREMIEEGTLREEGGAYRVASEPPTPK